jgi:hypothetical protein
MRSRLGRAVATVSLLVFSAGLIGAAPASARHSRRSLCARPAAAITLKATRRVRVYEVEGYNLDTGYACSKVNGRRTRLYQVGNQPGSGGLVDAIKGDYVQYFWEDPPGCRGDCPPNTPEAEGDGIVNARTGKPLTVPSDAAVEGFTAAGSIAWLTGSAPTEQLSDRTAGVTRLLDSGDISSIALRAGMLYWTNDGQQKSAPFQ